MDLLAPSLSWIDPVSPAAVQLLAGPCAPPPDLQRQEQPDTAVLHDFSLMPYRALPSPQPRAQTLNVMLKTFALQGVLREGEALIERLLALLGPQRMVWGAKRKLGSAEFSWELYFYRREHSPPELSIDYVRPAFAPLVLDARPPKDMAWTFFSVELTAAQLRGELRIAVQIYNEPAFLSWAIRGEDLEFENYYQYFLSATQVPELVAALRTSVHAPLHPRTLALLVPPQLLPCYRIWLARKRFRDAMYFQRVTVVQTLWTLRKHGWPTEFCDWFQEAAPFLQHALFDLSLDFERVAGGESGALPPLRFPKSGIYASF